MLRDYISRTGAFAGEAGRMGVAEAADFVEIEVARQRPALFFVGATCTDYQIWGLETGRSRMDGRRIFCK